MEDKLLSCSGTLMEAARTELLVVAEDVYGIYVDTRIDITVPPVNE